jgi:predicted RNase H-like HicB family nuclease
MSRPRKMFIRNSFPIEGVLNQFSSYTWTVATVTYAHGYQAGYADGQRSIAEIISEECDGEAMTLRIQRLKTKELKAPLDILIEPDADGFIAKAPDLPLYGYGDDRDEAIRNLQAEIETLYDDLMADDNFSEEWLQVKTFLKERVIN